MFSRKISSRRAGYLTHISSSEERLDVNKRMAIAGQAVIFLVKVGANGVL
jgi:hypothetical protein